MSRVAAAAFALALSTLLALPAGAADTLKLAIGQRGIWHGATADLGQRAGIFKKYDLVLEILYTAGAGETMQAVIAGSADVGVSVGTLGVLGAFAKGAPIRIIGSESVGEDAYWYVRPNSPVKSMADMAGPDNCVLDDGLLDPRQCAELDRRLQSRCQAGCNGRVPGDLHPGDVWPNRRRLGGTSLCHGGSAQRRDPGDRALVGTAAGEGPFGPRHHRQQPNHGRQA